MGASMTSPMPHRPQTSVCNHLFSPGDGGPTFAPQRETSRSSVKESVLMQGWNWGKKNIQPVMSRRSLPKSGSSSEATSSKSSDSLVSFTRNVSTSTSTTSSQYGKTTISLDRNQNYKTQASPVSIHKSSSRHQEARADNLTALYTSWQKRIPRPSDTTTIIPNYYSLREEFRRGLQINHRQDAVNNNLHTLSSAALSNGNNNGNDENLPTASPKHVARWVMPRSLLRDDNANDEPLLTEGETILSEASTSELLRGLGIFIANNCGVSDFDPAHLVTWLRSVDRSLLLQGWQDIAFINPANLVFIYMIVRDELPGQRRLIGTLEELHAWILSCLYVSYSYMGNEISYPLKPFLIGNDRSLFWNRCVAMVTTHSRKMLLLNSSSTYFTEVFTDLKRCSSE